MAVINLKDINKPVKEHLDKFNDYFKDLMRTEVPLLNLIIKYMTQKRGKQIRPALVFLSAMICGEINKRTYTGAGLVELLHSATLIHDDVVDKSDKRRGIATINAEWNNKIAVLIGDYLLACGLLSAIDSDEYYFLKLMSQSVRRMSEGELLQIQKSGELETSEETYFTIIANKTASLLSTCCSLGAASTSDDKSLHEKMAEYGELVGIAFQIKDDIMDYESSSIIIGKPVGNDLKEKKLTLPLIHAIQNVPKKQAKEILKIVKSGNIKNDNLKRVIDFVHENKGIEYSEQKALEYSDRAIQIISGFDSSAAKESLINFSNYVVKREK
ncbi:MAG: polyprenyl synthetase family protein [Candidatus Kapabacteria bacterium]|nr:polyprenyl synthetase family protein [Candidatus Kapabacteria bacterium]